MMICQWANWVMILKRFVVRRESTCDTIFVREREQSSILSAPTMFHLIIVIEIRSYCSRRNILTIARTDGSSLPSEMEILVLFFRSYSPISDSFADYARLRGAFRSLPRISLSYFSSVFWFECTFLIVKLNIGASLGKSNKSYDGKVL